MKRTLTSLLTLFLFNSVFCIAQSDDKKQQIAKAVTDYFHLERENIHVHFNKNVFLTDESVWFKGYVFHRKAGIPFFATTNIYASLIDSQGNILDTQLLYGSIAGFSGAFKLDDTFKSGKYYLQFYTNWMNNFIEDESATYEISVINPQTGAAGILGKPDLSQINITFHPEGGNIIKNAGNIIGISVGDCLNNPTGVSSADIVNDSGAVVKTVQLNKMGYGRFDLAANSAPGLKAVIKVNGKVHEQPLPDPQLKGIALEINNYTFPDKMIAKIRTNSLTANAHSGKPFFMLVQQDEKFLIHEFSFSNEKLEQTIVIPQNDLFEGTNTIRILDNELIEIGQRMVFKYPSAPALKAEISQTKKDNDYIELTGKLNYPAMNVSVSVLPEATVALASDNDIYGSLLIAPYIESQGKIAGKNFFESLSKVKHYELDLLMLNQASKYKWRDISIKPIKNTHTFDMGVTLKATLNNKLANYKNYKVRVVSTAGLFDEEVTINDKGEILLENMILADSSSVRFSLLEKGVKKEELKLYPQVFNNKKKFNKNYKPEPKECPVSVSDTLAGFTDLLPKFNNGTIILDAVEVKADKKELKHRKAPGNSQLRSYKITETESRSFLYLLDFIRYHGFNVENNGVSVGIYGRTINTINGQRTTPMIYIDNMQVLSPDQLQGVMTEDVDEFYVNPHAIVPSVNNRMGVIKIYMKKGFGHKSKEISDANYIVKDGFEQVVNFENATYNSTSDSGFINFGVIDWQPVILPDSKGEFTINVPNTSQKTIRLVIEGFSVDGKLISEIRTIQLQ